MLTRVRIQNFRAIEDLTLELRPFQVLIGENNSGKTSFLDALVALRRMCVDGPIKAWSNSARFDFPRNLREGAKDPAIRWDVTTSFGARYTLGIGQVGWQKQLLVSEEQLTSEPISFRRYWREGRMQYDGPPNTGDLGPDTMQLLNGQIPDISGILAFLRSMRRYALEPRVMTQPASPAAYLQYNGQGFPGFLDRLQNNAPEAFETLQGRVREVFKKVRFVRTPALEDGSRELAIVENGSSRPIYGSQLSDGLLLLIGYLAITLSPNESPNVLMLDEPEMGLHMDRAGFLVELLRGLSEGRFGRPVQVIVTTHSPDVVDFLKPEEVVVFERGEQGVRAERLADVKDLKQRLRGYNLGEYWSSYGESGLLRGGEG
jgi:predicted ATPase